jgi:hypothetical protein
MVRNLLDVVHGRDCGVSIGFLTISDETKTTATASVSVFYDHLNIVVSVLRFEE